MRVEVVKAIKTFQSTWYIPRGCNASFLTLVPKRVKPSTLDDFRPISLGGYLYKVLIAEQIENCATKGDRAPPRCFMSSLITKLAEEVLESLHQLECEENLQDRMWKLCMDEETYKRA